MTDVFFCLACGNEVADLARYFEESGDGYCHDCNPTDEAWAAELAECRAATEEAGDD